MNDYRLPRRHWLGLSAGAAVMGWSIPLPAAAHVKPFSFIIVSDTHLGRKDNQAAERNWRQAVKEISDAKGEFILHLGDVVDSGRPEQYPIYEETRRQLKKPIHEIPGNHDPVPLFQKHVAKQTDRSFDFEGVRFVLFNNSRRDSHDGFIVDDQLKWLDEQFNEAAKSNLKIVICCHVPIHRNRPPDRAWYVKPDNGQTRFYELLAAQQDRILACFHGHFHNGIRGWRDHGQTVEVLCPSVCYNQNRNLTKHIADGKADGFFVDELRAGYLLATIGEGRLTLRYKPLGKPVNGEYDARWS